MVRKVYVFIKEIIKLLFFVFPTTVILNFIVLARLPRVTWWIDDGCGFTFPPKPCYSLLRSLIVFSTLSFINLLVYLFFRKKNKEKILLIIALPLLVMIGMILVVNLSNFYCTYPPLNPSPIDPNVPVCSSSLKFLDSWVNPFFVRIIELVNKILVGY
ncbi:MAG: hypothetical protein WCV93_05320 [Candidatus Shapirobacteria bacterium]|jgi:hypothetical protein